MEENTGQVEEAAEVTEEPTGYKKATEDSRILEEL